MSEPPRTATPGRIVAHRGASRVAPENTLAAFRAAAAQGAAWVEFDISLLGDGTAVLHHDACFDRCSDRAGPLAHATAADLAAIDAGTWFGPAFAGEPVAPLEAALDLIGALGLSANLEMKQHDATPDAIAGRVAEALARRPWTARRVIVSSFEHGTLAALRQRLPAQPLALLWEEAPAGWVEAARALDAAAIHLDWQRCEPALIGEAAAAGLEVRLYTLNDPAQARAFREAGVTGIITDHPPLYLADPDWAAWAAADQAGSGTQ